MSGLRHRFWRCEHAASSAEFALVLPAVIALIFGTIDAGRFMWEMQQAEKATQVGARFAVVTTPVSTGLVAANYASGSLPAGSIIPASALGALKCNATTCTCVSNCPGVGTGVNSAAFTALVARMQAFKPDVGQNNVEVTYRGSGFGTAGGPTGEMEIEPLVTVSLTGISFAPLTAFTLVNIPLPAFSTTLPAEDSSGTYSH